MTFGPLNRFCGDKKHFPLLKQKLYMNKMASFIANAPQKSGSNIALFFVFDRKIANNPKQICTMKKENLTNPISATKNNSIVDTISAMEFYFLALKSLISVVFRVFFLL